MAPVFGAQGAWYALSWVEWTSVLGGLLGLIGLYLTWRQARDARRQAAAATTAAEAAQQAVLGTQRQLRGNQLLVLIPQLRWIASSLDDSIEADQPAPTRKHLENWRYSAANVQGILSSDNEVEKELLRQVQESVGLAFSANTALMKGKRPVMDACKHARDSIGLVCQDLTTWAGTQSQAVPAAEGEVTA